MRMRPYNDVGVLVCSLAPRSRWLAESVLNRGNGLPRIFAQERDYAAIERIPANGWRRRMTDKRQAGLQPSVGV